MPPSPYDEEDENTLGYIVPIVIICIRCGWLGYVGTRPCPECLGTFRTPVPWSEVEEEE